MKSKTLILIIVATRLAAAEAAHSLESLDLEQLMNLKVTSVQRKEQSVSQSAAAVWVITREDIRRAGISSVPEALRLAPGLHVARAATGIWAIGSRGFNGQFANKLQVLVDGRSVYHPLNSGVFWDSLDLMIEDIDRIEVIRGPGAVMWGANAVTGVINIITRRVEDTLGGFVEAGTGSEDRALTRLRVGRKLNESLGLRVSGQFVRRAQLQGESSPEDDSPFDTARGGFRLDWERNERERMILEGDLFRSQFGAVASIPELAYRGTVTRNTEWLESGASLLTRWTRDMFRGQTTAQIYYAELDHTRSDYVRANLKTVDIDLQHRVHLALGHDLLFGIGYRTIKDETQGKQQSIFSPASRRYDIPALTLQHEYQIRPERMFLTSGVRLERSAFSSWNGQPTVRFLWAPSKRTSLWGAVSRAVRTPARFDHDLTVVVGSMATPAGPLFTYKMPNSEFGPESLRAYEWGFRLQALRCFSLDAAAFYNGYHDLESRLPGKPSFDRNANRLILPVTSANLASGRGYGAELAAKLELNYKWRLAGSITQYRSRLSSSTPGVSVRPDVFPEVQYQLQSSYELSRRTQFNIGWYHTGETVMAQLFGQTEPAIVRAHDRLDVGVRWRFSEWAGAAAGVQNALNSRLQEFRPDDGSMPQAMRRSLYLRLQWWF